MSQHTKRYDLKNDGCGGQEMSERESGDWVMAADFDRAVYQRDELLAALRATREACKMVLSEVHRLSDSTSNAVVSGIYMADQAIAKSQQSPAVAVPEEASYLAELQKYAHTHMEIKHTVNPATWPNHSPWFRAGWDAALSLSAAPQASAEQKQVTKREWRKPTKEDKTRKCRARSRFEKRPFYVVWDQEYKVWCLEQRRHIWVRVEEILSPKVGVK